MSARSHVVFLRAANVGGKNVFRPAQLAAALAHLEVINVGAAGTFVVGKGTAATIRREILEHLPFAPDLAVIPSAQVLALVRSDPFKGVAFSKDLRGWAAALCGRPRERPSLPIEKPAGRAWKVRFDRLEGSFALGLLHRRPGAPVMPNALVDRALGVPTTTRWWETLQRVAELIER